MHKTDPTLHGLIDGWLAKLSGAEFKLAAYLYRNIGRRRKKQLSMSIAALAAATGISWRQTQAALKKLDELGIILRTGGRGRITCVQLPGSATTSQAWPSPCRTGGRATPLYRRSAAADPGRNLASPKSGRKPTVPQSRT